MDIFYDILNLEVGRNVGDHSDVVQSVDMKITVIGNLGSSYSETVKVDLSAPSGSFTNFNDITKNQVIGWFKLAYYVDGKTEDSLIEQFKSNIASGQNTYNYKPEWN